MRPRPCGGLCYTDGLSSATAARRGLVKEGYATVLLFSAHGDEVPEGEGDGGVVGVANFAPRVDLGVAAHGAPGLVLGVRVAAQQGAVDVFGEAAGVGGADVDGLAPVAVEVFDDVGLAAAALDWFVAQDEVVGGKGQLGAGEEEPLALADKAVVAPLVAILGLDVLLMLLGDDERRLEGFHGVADGGDAASLGNGGDKPVALIVTAEELLLGSVGRGGAPGEQKQMPLLGLHIHGEDIQGGAGGVWDGHGEDFAMAILGEVEHQVDRGVGADRWKPEAPVFGAGLLNMQLGSDTGELGLQGVGVHRVPRRCAKRREM